MYDADDDYCRGYYGVDLMDEEGFLELSLGIECVSERSVTVVRCVGGKVEQEFREV